MGIRCAEREDIPQILDIYGPYVTESTATFEYTVPTVEEFTRRFAKITEQFPFLVWEEEGTVLGYAYASAPFERAAYAWCAEPSIYLAPQAQGKGIGKKLYAALEQILCLQGYRVCYALITTENTHSLAFHEHMGYRPLAEFPQCGWKFDRWLGVTWMEKRFNAVDIPSNVPAKAEVIVKNNRKMRHILDNLSLF